MTVSTDIRRVQYATNGTTGPFTVTFPFLESSHLAVTYTDSAGADTLLTLNVDYTVSGSVVTTTLAYASGGVITIDRDIPITQELDLRDGDDFPSESVEEAFDKLTMIAQQVAIDSNRVLRVPEVSANIPLLPVVADRANKVLAFDANGDPDVMVPSSGSAADVLIQLANSASAAQGPSLVAYNPALAYAGGLGQFLNYQHARTAGEVAAGVTPTNYYFHEGDIRRYGADPAGAADSTAAIQAAINVTAPAKKRVTVPAGTYKVVPATLVTGEAGAETVAFLMASHMHIEAEPGAVFKLADSQSTDGTPKALEMFFTNQVLSNVTIRGLTMDMNGANNTISPSRPGTYDTSKNMGMICVSGTPGGVAARIDDCVIEGCTFKNTSGVCCIVVAQSNSTGVTLGKRWTIRNNLFLNNGTDTNDHTSIFAWADDVLCEGNTFWQDSQYATVGKTGGVTAYEVHGSNHRFIGNRVRNYFRGIWVGPNLTTTVEGSIIKGNNFETMFYGVDFFRASSSQTASRDTLIEGNTFLFDSDIYTGGPTQKAAVNIACNYAVSDIVIRGNILRSSDTATDAGTSLAIITPGSVAANTYKNIYIEDNAQYGGTDGVYVVTNATNGLGHLSIVNNRFVDLSNAAVSVAPIGVFVNGVTAVSSLVLDGNQSIETRGSPQFDYGIYVQGTVTNYMLGNNYAIGMVSANYTESSFTATTRIGPTASTVLTGSTTYDPPNLADGAGATTTVTVTGAAAGDFAQASFGGDTAGITITAWVSAANTVSVRFQNESGGTLDISSSTLRARVIKAA